MVDAWLAIVQFPLILSHRCGPLRERFTQPFLIEDIEDSRRSAGSGLPESVAPRKASPLGKRPVGNLMTRPA
jgi:hypothetical protein